MVDSIKSALSLITSTKNYSETERRIVDFILENREEASRMTAAQLSRGSGTSEATVSRFCRKLGFGSYRSFQFSLARDVAARERGGVTDEVSLENIEQSLKNITSSKLSEIEATISAIDRDDLRSVVNLIANSGVIQIAAVGSTNSVALDATFKFSQLGLRCVTNEISETGIGFSLTLTPKDVLIVISSSGRSKRLNRMLSAAKGNGATVVVITGDVNSPLAKHADYVFQTVNHEALLTTGDFAFSKMSAALIIEVIYNFLMPTIPDAREHISYYEELIQPDKLVE